MKIQIHQLNPEIKLTKKRLKDICRVTCNEIGLDTGSCDIIFVDDPTLEKMHKIYLNNPEPTDVITFDLGEESVEGEVYISVDRAKEQSGLYNVALDEEIIRLMIHGLLHLKGFNDIEDEDRKEMKKEEYRLIELVKKQVIT